MTNYTIQSTLDRLRNVVKSNLVQYYKEPLTPEIIEKLSIQISETLKDFIISEDCDDEG